VDLNLKVPDLYREGNVIYIVRTTRKKEIYIQKRIKERGRKSGFKNLNEGFKTTRGFTKINDAIF